MYVAHGWVDGYFDGAEVNHKDYNRTNYHADNLEWVSHKNNISYSSSVGRYSEGRRGSHNGRARMVSMYISETNETMIFETLGDCAKWAIDNGYARKSSQINSVRSRIISFIKSGENLKGLKFQYI